jgi:uncharacterized protein YkwD
VIATRVVPRRVGGVALVVIVGCAAALVVASRATAPVYVFGGDGIALGPAARHPRAGTDLLAQIATGALSSASGNADVRLPDLGAAPPTAQEQALLDLTNADRSRNGLPPLAFDPASLGVARVRAAAQIPDGPLSHYNSLGEIAFVGLLGDAGVQYSLAGENLARAQAQDSGIVQRLDEALMNSPTHRANILEPSFNRLAVGAAVGPDGRLAFAEIFRSATEPDNQAAAPSRWF